MSLKKVMYYIRDHFSGGPLFCFSWKTEVISTVNISRRTVTDLQSCLEKLTGQFPYKTAQSVDGTDANLKAAKY